ncbi:MAG: amino acid adenylation domain-containing protein [Nitrospira sp.]|nr:amino acid adenylation domain-containing protein [Nitrospira sp.]
MSDYESLIANPLIVDSYQLSPMQQGMLFHAIKEPHSGVDIEQVVVHLSEVVEGIRLERAWQWLVHRHDVLRTKFVWGSVEKPRQDIMAEVSLPFVIENAADIPKSERQDRLEQFLEEDRIRGFELDRAPMLRLTLFQWGEASYSLVWTFHHALLDGRCYPVLLQEVFEAYEELSQSGIKERPAPHSYRRYIDWISAKDHSASQGFWKEQLGGFSAPTPLVVDRLISRPSEAYRHGEVHGGLDPTTTAQLHEVAKCTGVTINTLLMSAWAILLYRYSGEEDIVFGATRACRRSSVEQAEDIVGLFINTVPVRVRLTGKDGAIDVAHTLRQQWVDIRPHEHTPLTMIKAASQLPPGQALFNSLVVFEHECLDRAMRSLGGHWKNRRLELFELTNFPVTLAAYDGAELNFKIEFDHHRLDSATVERMLGHLRRLLEGIAENHRVAVCDLPLLGDIERHELIESFNASAVGSMGGPLPIDGGATLHGLFECQVARQPEAIALTYEGETVTYRQLNAKANRLARELTQHGIKPDTLVGLCLERTPELVMAILAILKAGGAYLPIDLSYPAERLTFMLDDARAPVLVTQRRLAQRIPVTGAKIVFLDELLAGPLQPEDEVNLPISGTPDHLAYVIYTSGTTGKPKGSLIPHRNVVRLFSATEQWYGFNGQDVWTLFHSTAFDFSVWEIWGALLYGGRVVVVPFLVSRSPESFYDLLVREQVTVLNQTPSAFRQLIQAEEAIGQKNLALRYVIFGGEALELQSLRPWFDRHGDQMPQLVNMYGITETTVHVTYRPLSKDDLESGSVIGVPIPDLQVYILDEQKQPVPIGIPGEMYVGGSGLAKGYLRRPELTSERFVPDHLTGKEGRRLYRTGDLARFLPGRDIEYLGRIDHQVKIRGFRIELGEIESVLCQHPAVREAVAIAREDVPGIKTLAAYLVTSSPRPEVSALREHLKKKVPDYMVPAAFVFLDKFPLTNNGKIDRKALPAPEQQRSDLLDRYAEPRTPTEKKLVSIWSKVLRLERVGVHDNFFELGGDSILSIQAIAAARQAGVLMTAKQMFTFQTIAELGTAIDANQVIPLSQDIAEGNVPLTPIQRWFFEQNLDESHHYNQALLLKVSERLELQRLECALKELVRHHDALKFRYVQEETEWRQYYSPVDEASSVKWVDITDLDESGQARTIETETVSAHASLRLDQGPLWQVTYFDAGPDQPGRLSIVIHHLAVDGVSWRPILEDLETAYLQLKSGQSVRLPVKTASFRSWAEEVQEFAASHVAEEELAYWKAVTTSPIQLRAVEDPHHDVPAVENTEGTAKTVTVSLDANDTEALLHAVPAVYNTQINDVLLTALARAWQQATGSRVLFTNLEGHGREELIKQLDLSRTVGWFTSLFPVRVELPPSNGEWDPGEALKSVKEQLRRIPRHGIGYGLLRYLVNDSGLAELPEPSVVFNYFGQFDQVVSGSKLFRFSSMSSGPWHSPRQRRRHALEINSMVKEGRLELSWTYCPALHPTETIERLTSEFLAALTQLIEHCRQPSVGGRTPSDFPLAKLEQLAVDRLVAGRKDIEDIYRLSPIQSLFFSVNPGSQLSEFDQWQCTLRGTLNLEAFQRAWHETVHRHAILRSTIHEEGLTEPVQMVHRHVQLPWTIEDWRGVSAAEQATRWSTFLEKDRGQPLTLDEAPVMRLGLFRLTEEAWRFVWTVPALLLDGWSWPIVFRDASKLYASFSDDHRILLDPVRPYRDYVGWLNRQSSKDAQVYWQNNLKGFRIPTPLPSEAPDVSGEGERYPEHVVTFSPQLTADLHSLARRLQVTLSTLVQAAWALLLMRQSSGSDVVYGAAFAGRPVELRGAESIVGPFVNNIPIRVQTDAHSSLEEFLKHLQSHILEVSPYQFLPLLDIQECSELPWQYRPFDSLVVFQNYLVDDAARRFGGHIEIEDFKGPIHTNYPVLLLAEPGPTLRLTLIYDRQRIAMAAVERWGHDLAILMKSMPGSLDRSLSELRDKLSEPPPRGVWCRKRIHAASQNVVPPQTDLETSISVVWQKMFGLEQVSVEDNLFDLGGHSLLLVTMHSRLRMALKRDFPLVTLFTHPTIRSLARYLEQGEHSASQSSEPWKNRAQQQKAAMAHMRSKWRKKA